MGNSTTRPRILLVSAADIVAGGEVYYIKLARLLLRQYDLGAVVFNSILQSEFENLGMQVWRGELSKPARLFDKYFLISKEMLRAIREFSPALVHLNGGAEAYLAFIPRLYGIPVLITNHIVRTITLSSIPKRLALSVSTWIAETTICVSKTAERNLHKYAWTIKTVIIPNWLESLPERYIREPYDGTRPFRLLFVGRIESEKGIYDLIRAMKYLQDVHLDIVGDGTGKERAMDESISLPVHFHGFKKQVMSFYRDADLLIFPSYSESQGLVLLEAMSCGLPCLASDIEAVLETTGGGHCAEIFHCGDPLDLAMKLEQLQKNQSRLSHLSESGRAHVLGAFTQERVSQTYFDLVHSIILV